MNSILFRSATLFALLVFCLPAIAQRTRVESQGEAFVAAEEKAMVETALERHVFGVPPSGKGQIVFFRSERVPGTAFAVHESGTELAQLPSASYFIVAVLPGMHAFTIDAETGGMLTMQIRPGRTYFVRAASRRTEGAHPYLMRADAMTFLDIATGRQNSIL